MSDALDGAPEVDVALVEDRTEQSTCSEGFLKLRRLVLQNRYPDGQKSASYAYDLVDRAALDAVAIVLFEEREDGVRVCLRTALRPPLAFRDDGVSAVQWEIPAGLIEPGEVGAEGARRCASREALEEVGATLAPESFEALGPAVTLSPGVIAERLHFLAARVDPSTLVTPTEDGSPVEERAAVRFVPIEEALAACRDGRVADIKTETGVRRLAERVCPS